MNAPRLLFALSLQAAILSSAVAQGDNFDDGNSDGWTELLPLSTVGGTGSFSFPGGNTYRIQSGPSPNEEALGQSRAGAIREDVSYTDFYQFVDVVDYDQALDQNIGMLARVKEPGLGTTDGYGVTYNPTDQAMFLTVITDEGGDNIADSDVFIDPGTPVRLVFQGVGSQLKFEVFLLSDLQNAVASIEIDDSTYTSGFSGIFVVTDGGDPAKPTDCTFDNYFAATTEPFEFRIVGVEIVGGDVVIDFLSQPGRVYSLWHSGDLQDWEEIRDDIEGALGSETSVVTAKPDTDRHFFEIRLQ